MKKAIIVLGHGSKAPEALETLKKYGEMIKAVSDYDVVEIASLQFNQPDLPTTLNSLISKGVTKIVIAPLFLYNGIHMQEDIPEVLNDFKAQNPGIEIVMAGNLGSDSRIVDVVLDRIKEVS